MPVINTDTEGNRPVKESVSIDSRRTVKNKLITKVLDKKTPKQRTDYKNRKTRGKKADSSYRYDGFCGRGGYTTFTQTFDKYGAQEFINSFVVSDPWEIIAGSLGEIGEFVMAGVTATGETVIEQLVWGGAVTIPSVVGCTIREVSDYNMFEAASNQIDSMSDNSVVQVTVLIWDNGDFSYSVSELG